MACGVVVTATLLMVIMIVVMVRFMIFQTEKPVVMTYQGMRSANTIHCKGVVNPTVLLQFIP